MVKFKLVSPKVEHEKLAIDYIDEFEGVVVNGAGSLDKMLREGKTYKDWLEKIANDRKIVPSEVSVPKETFFLMDKDETRVYGMINIRLALNSKFIKVNGNIGYSIRPTERRKGYNKINLYLALKVCDEHGLDKVMVDCDEDNLGSKNTILALGGELEYSHFSEEYNTVVEVYWINVKQSLNENYEKYEAFIEG